MGKIMRKEVTVLMPCLNEEKTIKICIDKAFKFFDDYNIDGEVLIADNGSTDNSIDIVKSSRARMIHVEQRGYGSALINGIHNAEGKYIITSDSDDSYDLDNLMPFLEKLREGYDLVMGDRYKGGFEEGAMTFSHYYGVKFLTHSANIIHGTRFGDYHCGLRGFNTEKFRALDLECPGMEFASEMIIKAKKAGYSMVEIPTKLSPTGRDGDPHLNTIRDGFRHLFLIIKLI